MTPQEIQIQEKKELEGQEEKTEPGRFFLPHTDIHESPDALFVIMEMPGVSKDNVDIHLEKNTLTITGNVSFSNYENLKPIYTEYNVGNFTRSFTLSSEIEQSGIKASMENGVLHVHLPKIKEAAATKISVQ